MATLFSLNNGNFLDYNTLGFSLPSAEITNNTTGISVPSNKAYCVPFVENLSSYVLSAISVHLSAVASSPVGTFGLVINKYNKSTFDRTTVVENYQISEFTSYDGTNNFSNTYPSNWHTLNLSTPITVLSSETILLCLSTSNASQLSLMGAQNVVVNRAGFNAPTLAGTLSTSSTILPYSYFTDSLYFDGSTNWYTFPANSRYTLNGSFTIEFWINTSTFALDTNNRRIFGSSAVFSPSNLEILFLAASNTIKVQTNNITRIDGNFAVANGNWHHVALSRNGNSMKLFVDGAQSGATYTNTENFSAGSVSGFTIGKYGGAANGRFQGYLSNIHVVNGTSLYNNAFTLTPTILEPVPTSNTVLLLKSGVQIDKAFVTTGNPILTSGPLIEYGTISRSTSGTYFNGTDSKIEYTESSLSNQIIPASGNFTFETLFYVQVAPTVGNGVTIFSLNPDVFDVSLGTDMNASFYFSSAPNAVTVAAGSVALNKWTHLAITRFGGKYYSFNNGKLINITNTTVGFNHKSQNTLNLYQLGFYAYQGLYFNGYVSYMKAVKDAKYTSDFIPNLDPEQYINNSPQQTFLYTQSTSGYYNTNSSGVNKYDTFSYDNYHINHNINLDSSIDAASIYIHKNGKLNFSNTTGNSILVKGVDGIQVTQEGTLNIGTSSSVVPLSTTHTITLSNNSIDVHNGGNLNIYGYPKQLYTSLENDFGVGQVAFTITGDVSSSWMAGDTLSFIPNTTQKFNFDQLVLGGFTDYKTLTTNSVALYNHLGIASNPYVPSIYNITRNVRLNTYSGTKFNMKCLASAKVSISNAYHDNLGDFGIRSVLNNEGYLKLNSNIYANLKTQSLLTSDNNLAYSTRFDAKRMVTNSSSSNLVLNTTDFTLEFNFFHIANTTGPIMTRWKSTGFGGTTNVLLEVLANNVLSFKAGANVSSPDISINGTIKNNYWNKIVITHQVSNKTIKLYINGKLSNTNVYSNWNTEVDFYYRFGYYGYTISQSPYGVIVDNSSGSYINNFRITNSLLYTNNFYPDFSTLLVLPNTKLLLFQEKIIRDVSNTWTITTNTFITYNVNPNRNYTNLLFNNNIITGSIYDGLLFTTARFNNTLINDNFILSCASYGINMTDSIGIYTLSGNNVISNKLGGINFDSNSYSGISLYNIVYNCSGNGFDIASIDGSLFKNNIAAYNQGIGFYINDVNSDIPTGTIIGLSSLYNKTNGFYNGTTTVDLFITNANISYNGYTGLAGFFSNNSILSGIKSTYNGVDGIYINTLYGNTGLSGVQIYDSTITNNLSYGLRLSAATTNYYYGLTANNLLLSSNGINGLHVSYGNNCLITNINSLCNNSNGIFLGPTKNSIIDLLSGNYNKVNGLSLTVSATDFILKDSTFSYNLSNGINLSGIDMLNSNIELHECILSANKVNGLNSTVLSANHLNINTSIISNNVIGYALNSNYVDSIQIVNSTLNNNSVGFLLSGTSTNYLNPTDVVFSNLTVENNTTNGIEIYNIIGSISSVRLYNNGSNGIITSIGNGIMIFDVISGYATGTRNVINVISARNYSQTIIRNSILSCVDVLNTANLIKINMEKLEEFRLENTILSSTNPLTFTTNRPKLEGSFMFHNCNSDKYNLSAIAVTQYQSDVFTETGMSVMKENNIEGNHYKWLPAGKISFDTTFGHDVNTFSEKLEPASIAVKLRSSSKLIPLLKNEIIMVSVYVYKSASYTGSSPRLILKNNPSIGFTETVLATSNGVNGSWELLTATLPITTNDGVAELYIDCSGAIGSGSINIDSWNF